MKNRIIFFLLMLCVPVSLLAQVTVTGSTGADGNYTRLGLAFTALNGTAQTGNSIVVTITGNTTETAVAQLTAGTWTSLVIYPTVSGLSITGNLTTPLINLNGADNVTIDGRVGQTGPADLTIANTGLGNASTIQFANSAQLNTVQYCRITGSGPSTGRGIILFTTSTAGGTGSDGNTIVNNEISGGSTGRPANAIFSAGSAGRENSENIISNNNFYDFLNKGVNSTGVFIGRNNSAWTISGNSFYETTSFVPTASVTYYFIRINSTTGANYSVSDNFIGGSGPSCSGTWVKTNSLNSIFFGIYVNVAAGTVSNIQNNTIRGFDWSNSAGANWTGIHAAAGDMTISGNTIGDITGSGSILVTGAARNNVYGINLTTTGTVICQNNNIGSITAGNVSANASFIYGIYKPGAGSTTITSNTIGSVDTPNSIFASSPSTTAAQSVFGVYNAGAGTITISNNTIANLTNGTTDTDAADLGEINGICSINGTNIITNNIIHDISNGNANSQSNGNASVCGISLLGATPKTVSGNTIYNLSNVYSAFTGSVAGLYYSGNMAGNTVSGNFIHSLSVSGSSAAASVYGIKIASGASTYSNNVISLGGTTGTTLYGIYETGTAGNNNNLYFNTVYIGGSTGAANLSYALYSAVVTNSRDFRNNIFVNARSSVGTNYAAFILTAGGVLTCDYNDYWVSGTGGMAGYYAGNSPVLPVVAGQDLGSKAVNPGFASPGGLTPTDYIPSNGTLGGVSGTGILADFAGTTRSTTLPAMGAFEIAISAPVQVYISSVLQASYTTLKGAFDAINAGTHTGAIEIRIYNSTIETASAVLNASGGSSNYSSVIIFPATSGVSINGNLASPLIDLNGADNVTIDGRLNASGNTNDLIINNASISAIAGTSTIRFINDATSDFIKYCYIKGSTTDASAGILFFSSASSAGNNGNTIDLNDITSSSDAARPSNVIFSSGTASLANSGNIISNNNIHNFLNRGIASNGINLDANTTAWTISGNSFYEAAAFTPTVSVAYNVLRINNPSGTGFTISGNYIGGSAALCGGTPWTKTGQNTVFTAIYLNAGTGTASNIQNNFIQNINWSNSSSASWTGINIAGGDANIGTTTGNTIGATTGTGSITFSASVTAANFYGVNITGTGTINCQNNKIGSVTVANTVVANSTSFFGINKTNTAGNTTISNNTIGSTTTANSINATSPSTGNGDDQTVYGIYNAGTGTITMSGNIIAHLTNGTTSGRATTPGLINGIASTSGVNIITNNVIHDLTIANDNTAIDNTSSVSGIALTGSTLKTVTGNTIYNLSNTKATFAGNVIGLYFAAGTGANIVAGNFIHGLSVSGSSNSASIYGIKVFSGATTYYNNIITLGGNTRTTIYGIYETGSAGNNNNLYFNTVFIGGTPTAGSSPSYALYNNATSNTRNFRNNLFVNARSNNGSHYAIRLAGTAGLTIDYNDYYASGTGGILGYLGSNRTTIAAWRTATGQDVNSASSDPVFTTAGGSAATDYIPGAGLTGVTGTGITTDYGMITRANPPSMGAWEGKLNKWRGTISTDWNTPGNWTDGNVPLADANIGFDAAAINDCQMDQDRSVNNIINSTTHKILTSGHKLTLKGNMVFSGGAQIDASAAGSVIEFAGAAAQAIPAGAISQVYDLAINNIFNVTLSGTLNLLNSITITSGLLDASTNSPTMAYGGTTAQTISAGQFLGEKVYNLTIDNPASVTLNTNFTVDNALTINPAGILNLNLNGQATVTSLVNNGVLNLNSSSAGIFSLMMNSYSGTGIANAQIFMTGGGDPDFNYHYVAVPVDGLPITFFTSVDQYNLRAYNDSRVVTSDFNGWSWWDGWDGQPGIAGGGEFNTMSYGKGYLFYHDQDATVNLTSLPSLGTTLGTIPLQYSGPTTGLAIYGYNLLGNSLTCSLDWNKVTFSGPVGQTVYYTTGNKWASYLNGPGGTNGGGQFIPPLQGFFVKAEGTGGSVNLSNAKVHQTVQNRYKKSLSAENEVSEEIVYPKVKLELSGTETSDETIIWFNDETRSTFNKFHDGYKIFSSQAAEGQLYSITGGANYVINGISIPGDSTIIPLGLKIASPGNYSITKNVMEELDNYNVYLVDKANGNYTVDLKKSDRYTFSADPGTIANRFILKFVSMAAASETHITNKKFNIYSTTNFINILPPDDFSGSPTGNIRVYGLTGTIVSQTNDVGIERGTLIQIPFNGRQGVYIVEIVSGLSRFTGKIVVK